MSPRVEHLPGGVSLYCGDCRDVLPTLGKIDAVVTDPPYGQRQNTNVVGKGGIRAVTPPGCGARAIANVVRAVNSGGGRGQKGAPGRLDSSGIAKVWPSGIVGDDGPFDPAPLLQAADRVLIWGAHRFADRLPPGTWLVWDKVPTGKVRDQGDGEAAWINDDPPRPMRIFRLLWDGVCVGAAARSEVTAGQQREHPTQKPVALMEWCLEQAGVRPGEVVVDPYMGAGSTGIAAVKRGCRFVGIEIEPVYFDAARRRIAAALRQPSLFVAPPQPTATQGALL